MNPKHCGDAKDFFKRGFLCMVRTFKILRGPRIFPLFSKQCEQQEVEDYISILGVDLLDLVSTARFYPHQMRSSYFDAAVTEEHCRADLFLDPDRGLSIASRNDREVVSLQEVSGLLPCTTDRIVMVYDEAVNRSDREGATRDKIRALRANSGGLDAFVYFNSSPSHPNIVCVSNTTGSGRLQQLCTSLEQAGIPRRKLIS
jgi:hypothetical protein